MSRTDTQESNAPASAGAQSFPHATVQELNERCLDLLVHQARTDSNPPFQLASSLRELLHRTTPETRRRAAERTILLLDLEFQSAEWWEAVRRYPDKQFRTPSRRGSFPRRSGLPLARATLFLAREGCRANLDTARVLFGMARPVADLIAGLQLTDVDRIVERRFRHLHPRWHDQPDIWRALLTASDSPATTALRGTDLQGLQLIAGELILSARRADRTT